MNFAALKTALSDRGFQHLDDATRGRLINDARQRLDNTCFWPYREDSETGVAPLTITDLDTVEAVINLDLQYPLKFRSFQSLLDDYGDLSLSGTPVWFYIGQPAGVPEIATYPADSSATIGVQYYRVTPLLVNDADTPLVPVDYHELIVSLAAERAYLLTDNFTAARELSQFNAVDLQEMVGALMIRQITGSSNETAVVDSCDW